MDWVVGVGGKGRKKRKRRGLGKQSKRGAPTNQESQECMGTKRGAGSHRSAQSKWLSLYRKETLGEGESALGKERVG